MKNEVIRGNKATYTITTDSAGVSELTIEGHELYADQTFKTGTFDYYSCKKAVEWLEAGHRMFLKLR